MRPCSKIIPLAPTYIFTHLLNKYVVPSIYVSRIFHLKSFDIHSTSFPHVPYKLLPPIKKYFRRLSFFFLFHFHRTLLSWACGSLQLREPQKIFSNSLFVHSLLCQITHSFLNGFQPNLCQHFSHVCSTYHAIFSLK